MFASCVRTEGPSAPATVCESAVSGVGGEPSPVAFQTALRSIVSKVIEKETRKGAYVGRDLLACREFNDLLSSCNYPGIRDAASVAQFLRSEMRIEVTDWATRDKSRRYYVFLEDLRNGGEGETD